MKEIIKHDLLPVNKYSIEILSTAECIHQFYFYSTLKELYKKIEELQNKGDIIRKVDEY